MVGSTWNQKREDLGSRWISPSSSVCLGEVPELLEPEQPQLSDTFMVGKRVKWGFPGGSDGKKSACSAGDRFHPWVWKIPWRREWLPTLVFLPGEFHGQRILTIYSIYIISCHLQIVIVLLLPFQFGCLLFFFSCLIALFKTPNTILN